MDKATVETIVIDDDDDNGITVPKRERKPSAKPGQVIFPADLPKNVVQLIRLWQHVYCIQTPRIFKDKGNREGKDIEYVHAQTGRSLFVRAFALDWMRKGRNPKNSERLLVASGAPLVGSIILARSRPYSNHFRAWGGAFDNPNEQAIVIRRPVHEDDNATFLAKLEKDVNRPSPPTFRLNRQKGSAQIRASSGPPPRPTADSSFHGFNPDLSTAFQAKLLAPGSSQRIRHRTADDYNAYTKVSKTLFHFRSSAGNALRIRTALQCQTCENLFANAIAGGVLAADERFPVLDCNITLTNGRVRRQIIADQEDFSELVSTVMADESWTGPGDRCVIVVNKFKGIN